MNLRTSVCSGLLGGCLLMIAASQPADLKRVPALQQPIRLQCKMRPLRELIGQVAQRTGARLGIEKTIEQYKITLFVREQPAWQVLTSLAHLLELEWRVAEGGGYYLALPARVREREQSRRPAEAALRQQVQQQLAQYQQLAQTDFADLTQRLQIIERQREQIEAQKPTGWQDKLTALAHERAQIAPVAESLPCYLLGRVIPQFGREEWVRFWEGMPLLASTHPHGTMLSLPEATLQWLSLWAPRSASEPPVSVQLLIHFRPEHRVLRLVLIAHCRVEYFTMTHEVSFPIVRDITAVAAPTEPLRKPAWWDDPLTHPSQQQPIRSEYYGGVFTLSDHLEWLAQQNEKIAIIAESFRLPTHQRDPDRGARTVGEWLLSVQRHEPVQMELNENTVLIRYQERAELRRSEIAESVLEPLEARARSLGGLTLDEYAMLANALTPAQQRRLEQPKGFALRFNPTPLQGGVPALRFWANLTPEQRKTARERRPLPYEQLSTVQQRLFWDAMEWGLTRPNIPTGHLLKQLERLHDPAASGELAFFLDDWKSVAYRVSNGDITLVFEDAESYQQSLPNLPGGGAGFRMTALSLHTYQFHFGFDTQHAVIFPLVVEEPAPRPESSQ